jgi:hypothetical protein
VCDVVNRESYLLFLARGRNERLRLSSVGLSVHLDLLKRRRECFLALLLKGFADSSSDYCMSRLKLGRSFTCRKVDDVRRPGKYPEPVCTTVPDRPLRFISREYYVLYCTTRELSQVLLENTSLPSPSVPLEGGCSGGHDHPVDGWARPFMALATS